MKEQYEYPSVASETEPIVFYASGSKRDPTNWKTMTYKCLTKNCRDLVDDLMQSALVIHRWDDNKMKEYYTKVIISAYDLGKENNE